MHIHAGCGLGLRSHKGLLPPLHNVQIWLTPPPLVALPIGLAQQRCERRPAEVGRAGGIAGDKHVLGRDRGGNHGISDERPISGDGDETLLGWRTCNTLPSRPPAVRSVTAPWKVAISWWRPASRGAASTGLAPTSSPCWHCATSFAATAGKRTWPHIAATLRLQERQKRNERRQ